MFKLLTIGGALCLFGSTAWFAMAIVRHLFASKRRSTTIHLKLASVTIVIGLAAVLTGAQNQYRGHGLKKSDALEEAQASEVQPNAANVTNNKQGTNVARARECHDVAEAYVRSQQFVKTRLKAPSTASFHGLLTMMFL